MDADNEERPAGEARHAFVLRYEDADMRAAARAFVLQGFVDGRKGTMVVLGLVVALAVLVLALGGQRAWALALAATLVFGVPALLILAYAAHLASMRARVRRMAEPRALVLFRDDGFTITADSGAATLPWTRVRGVWDAGRCWLLVVARNQFLTPPKRDAPADAIAFARGRAGVSNPSPSR